MHRHSVGNICPDDNHSIVRLFTTWLAASREKLASGSTATTPSAPLPKRIAVSVESPPQVSALPPTWSIGSRRARLWPLSASRPSPTDLLPPSALPRSDFSGRSGRCHSHSVGLTWFDLVWLGVALLDADASCLREIHLAPELPFQAPPRHIPGPGGTKLCSPAPILRANCLIINNGRCQVNFTKRCMRVHSGYACVADVLTSHSRLLYTAVTDVVGWSKQTSFRKVS